MFLGKTGIAIVDDDGDLLEIISKIVHDKYPTSFFQSAEDLMSAINAGYLPEIIISDINMGGISGHELCERISDINMGGISGHELCERIKGQDLTKNIPFIFMTGEHLNLFKAVDEGATGILNKPFSKQQFYKVIDDLIHG